MSEYQYLAFRAIDKPVNEKNLKFMRQQSSRAEITPWSFDNKYQYGDFHGDAAEMLRRGYDFHLHYANFGIRTLMIRLPNGLPDADAARAYFDQHFGTQGKQALEQCIHVQTSRVKIGAAASVFVIAGAVQMLRLRTRSLARLGSILAMVLVYLLSAGSSVRHLVHRGIEQTGSEGRFSVTRPCPVT